MKPSKTCFVLSTNLGNLECVDETQVDVAFSHLKEIAGERIDVASCQVFKVKIYQLPKKF